MAAIVVRPEPYDRSRKLICGLLALGRNSGTAVLLVLRRKRPSVCVLNQGAQDEMAATGQSSRFSGMMLLIAAAFT